MNYEQEMIEMIKGGGCFVNTRLSLYRANKRLTKEELKLESLPEKLVTMGALKLLPDEICPEMKLIKQIENKVNAIVNLRTFEFEGFGRYLKNSNADSFAAEIEQLRVEFNQRVQEFEEHYEEYIERSVEFWGKHAGALDLYPSAFKQTVREAFIPRHALRDKFKFTVTYLEIPNPAKDAWKNCETEYKALSADFLETTMRQLRAEACTAMEDIAASIESGAWNQKTLNKLPKMLERIEQMQIVPDEQLKQRIEDFKREFVTMEAKDYKAENGAAALSRLRTGLTAAVGELREMAEADLKASLERKLSATGGRRIAF